MVRVLLVIACAMLLMQTAVMSGETDNEKLIDLLVQKGLITQEEAAALRAEQAIKKQEDKSNQKEFPVNASKLIKLGAYTQARFQATFNKDSIPNSFDIRRARVDTKGEITGRFDYRLQVEWAGSSAKLLDATMGYRPFQFIKLTAGQFKVPFSRENLLSSPKLETVNRAQVVEALVARSKDAIGNQNGRDIGIMVSGSAIDIRDWQVLDYACGGFNGAGINTTDINQHKDKVVQAVLHPLKNIGVGGAYYTGWGKARRRDRVGAELTGAFAPFVFRSEYIRGDDGDTTRAGWYAMAAMSLLSNKLQAVLKFDTYDADCSVDDNEKNVYTIGLNSCVNKWFFIQVNYELKAEEKNESKNDVLSTQATLQF